MTVVQPDGYLALPKTSNGTGVLVIHAWWGLNSFFKDLCRRLAREGFTAFAPDLYHGKVASTIAKATRLRDGLDRKQANKDLHNAVAYLQEIKAVTTLPLGVIGFSLGANFALGVSRQLPHAIGAVVCFYGTRSGDYAAARAAYLGHFAESDEWESAAGVKRLEQQLQAAQRPVTFHTYPGTGHWFFEKDRVGAYNAWAAKLAWQRTLDFLEATLVPRIEQ